MILAILFLLAQAEAAPEAGAALAAALRAIRQDGPVALPSAAQRDAVAMLPPARKGEECPEPAQVAAQSHGLKDRGDGAVLVAQVTSCKGARIYAFASGLPTRVARLVDTSEAESIRSVKALNLTGSKREEDLALELFTAAASTELRLFTRRDTGFAFGEVGALREFASIRECASGSEEGSGHASTVKTEKGGLEVLRIDARCGGAPWQASCSFWRLERDSLARSGVCSLPQRLDAKALRAAGWR